MLGDDLSPVNSNLLNFFPENILGSKKNGAPRRMRLENGVILDRFTSLPIGVGRFHRLRATDTLATAAHRLTKIFQSALMMKIGLSSREP